MLLELGVGADILHGIGWLIWLLIAVALGMAFAKPKTKLGKAVAVSLVLGVVASIFVPEAIRQYEHKKRYAKAKALFQERCKTAGEKIYRTVEEVEGVLLLKIRSNRSGLSDQFELSDPYGHDVWGDGYILSFLRSVSQGNQEPYYSFVDVVGDGGGMLRYSAIERKSPSGNAFMQLVATDSKPSSYRYAVNFSDISSREDRENWIAGGRLEVLDRTENTSIAIRQGYIFDPLLGNASEGRNPWLGAVSCGGDDRGYGHNARFVKKVIRPTGG